MKQPCNPIVKTSLSLFLFLVLAARVRAQTQDLDQAVVYTGELGISFGGAEYFGDLNPDGSFRAVQPAFGIFYRAFFNPYIGLRAQLHYAQVGFSDALNRNSVYQTRNLSFNSHILEFSLQGDFNFFKFTPGTSDRFTPYITFGVGIFGFNPYAYYQNQKYYLQPLGTEGQGSYAYPDRKPYPLHALCFPIGAGIKYNLTKKINIGFEAVHRITTTDYLDDVSTTYAGTNVFPPQPNGQPSISYLLQDRSGQNGSAPIGITGRQRGNPRNRDQYLIFEVNISLLFSTYTCPSF